MMDRAPFLLTMMSLSLAAAVGCASPALAQADTAPTPAAEQEPAQNDPAAVELLQKIEAASAPIKTLRTRVKYTRVQGLTEESQVRFGDFYYAAQSEDTPTRFAILFDRLEIESKKVRKMKTWYIFDGNWLLERDHEDKTATRRELVSKGAERPDELNMGEGQMPIPLKLKADQVLDRYTVKRFPDEPSEFDGDLTLHKLVLTPKNNKNASKLVLWFDAKNLMLSKVVTEEDGDTIIMDFSNLKPNSDINDEVFDTHLPSEKDGWEVQEVSIGN